jgi:hypothetical protein
MKLRAKLVFSIGLLGLVCLMLPGSARADTYTYVGSFVVDQTPAVSWTLNPPVYTAQEAAAIIFGGSASDYAISTIDSSPADINFDAWVDGWSDVSHLGGSFGGTPVAENYDLSNASDPGYYNCGFTSCSFSALVMDHGPGGHPGVNYVFSVTAATPEPSALALLGSGLASLLFIGGIFRRQFVS